MLQGQYILIAKNGILVALDLQDTVTELEGKAVVMTRLPEALACARGEPLTAAVLGSDLEGASTLPICEALRTRRIPFLFYTANLGDDLPRDVPVVPNPSPSRVLVAALCDLLAAKGANS